MTEIKDQLKENIRLVPEKPGVYLFRNQAGTIIYVGNAISLRKRLGSYFQVQNHHPRIRRMLEVIKSFDYIVTDSEVEALILECNLIKEYQPRFNVNLKDDKSYPYLKVTSDKFPRVVVTRRLVRDGGRYFGPYPDVKAVREALVFLRKLFPFRTCSDKELSPRSRPCLNGQIKLCLAPCTGQADAEAYREMISQLVCFLEGKTGEVKKRLHRQMDEAIQGLQFEKAALIRDQLETIEQLKEKQRVSRSAGSDEDILAQGSFLQEACVVVCHVRSGNLISQEHFFLTGTEEMACGEVLEAFIKQYYYAGRELPERLLVACPLVEAEILAEWLTTKKGRKVEIRFPKRGRGRELLRLALENAVLYAKQRYERKIRDKDKGKLLTEELQQALGLSFLPEVLECVDISHLAGKETVGSLVRFVKGRPEPAGYRHYRIQSVCGGDDYRALQEVIRRRYRQGSQMLPDLLIIDGGKGQLSAVLAVLEELKVVLPGVISLAKKEEEVYFPGKKQPLRIPLSHPGLHLLQQARDEAHRFAIAYQRKLRESNIKESLLMQAPGIGKKRQEILLRHFGSLSGVKKAGVEELAAVPGMNKKVALALQRFFLGESENKTGKQIGSYKHAEVRNEN